ncbi:PaaI family thioesterase [Nocardia sp. GAS34]|uniref:PaaI family thioesterase n=1 Tax=unclassified Nocardia TaxID=2637762 RepID=UPI003D1BB3C1
MPRRGARTCDNKHRADRVGIDLSVGFLAPIRVDTGPVLRTGTVRHLGSRVALAEAAITGRAGKLLATATSSCLLFAVPGTASGPCTAGRCERIAALDSR